MQKGYYHFGESGALCKGLSLASGVWSFVHVVLYIFLFGRTGRIDYATGNTAYGIWCAFFLLLSIVLLLLVFRVNKVCRDIAAHLKEIEQKVSKDRAEGSTRSDETEGFDD